MKWTDTFEFHELRFRMRCAPGNHIRFIEQKQSFCPKETMLDKAAGSRQIENEKRPLKSIVNTP